MPLDRSIPRISSCLVRCSWWLASLLPQDSSQRNCAAIDAAALERAKLATIGVLEDTQDQRTPDKPGKILVRGTGFHLRDGYIVTARHAAEKHDATTGLSFRNRSVS